MNETEQTEIDNLKSENTSLQIKIDNLENYLASSLNKESR